MAMSLGERLFGNVDICSITYSLLPEEKSRILDWFTKFSSKCGNELEYAMRLLKWFSDHEDLDFYGYTSSHTAENFYIQVSMEYDIPENLVFQCLLDAKKILFDQVKE